MPQDDYVPLDTAKNIIVTALEQFDPELGLRAANTLFDDRYNIVEAPEPKTNMMLCRPAGITVADLEARNMYIPDYEEKFGPYFTAQENLSSRAIIDFEYHGNFRSVIWLAHELGHAIADDVQKENGHSFRDFSPGQMEEQAYFVQHIVSRYVKDHVSQTELGNADLGEDILKMSWDRAAQYTNAGKTYKDALAKPPDERDGIVRNALDQRISGPT